MAHVVGVPKRDPCRKCQLPVFLAERLLVGKRVYHRTCLKCARCGYQLTPGSFYETEVDEQYCCETCPDEEISKSGSELFESNVAVAGGLVIEERGSNIECENNSLLSPVKSVRNSIRDRLAFFENQQDQGESDRKLLQKSLSDEEKSKSLQRIESPTCNVAGAVYKPNVAFTNFLQNDNEEDISETSTQNSKMETSDSDGDDDNLTNTSLPPELPKSLPPIEILKVEKKSEEQKRFSVSTQLVLGSSQNSDEETANADKEQNIIREPVQLTSKLQINLLSNATIDKTNNNDTHVDKSLSSQAEEISEDQMQKETVHLQPNKLESNLECSKTNDNCITKDNSADVFATEKTVENISQIYDTEIDKHDINMCKDQTETYDVPNNEPIKEDVVELSLQPDKRNLDVTLQSEDNETTERLSVVRARLQTFEVIANNENTKEDSSQLQEHVNHDEISTNKKETLKSIENVSINVEFCKSTVQPKFNNTNIPTENETQKDAFVNDKVPLRMETKDNEILESNIDNKQCSLERINSKKSIDNISSPQKNTSKINVEDNPEELSPQKNTSKINVEDYPEELNPFKSDDEDQTEIENNKENVELQNSKKKSNLNPFDSSDDEVELEKNQNLGKTISSTPKVPPPRPPPPRLSKNPFDSDEEDDIKVQNFKRRASLTGSQSKKTPVPTPRSNISQSQNPTPEPTPRFSTKSNTTFSASPTANNSSTSILKNSSDYYGSSNSLHSSNTTPHNLLRNSDVRSSSNSLNLSAGGTIRSRKSRRAPLPPAPVKELFPSNETINSSSKTSTPCSSTVGTPKSARKKRPAPAPPKPARLEASQESQMQVVDRNNTQPKNLISYPLQSELDSKLSDEEKALLEGKTLQSPHNNESNLTLSPSVRRSSKRLIPLDKELLEEHGSLQYRDSDIISQCDDLKQQNQQKSASVQEEEPNVVYRRLLIPQNLETPTHEHNPFIEDLSKSLGERQLEKLKDNKEANNRNRQSQISVASSGGDDNDPLFNKSAHGKWKRRKGPAPALPIPPRKVLQMLPLQEIKHELEIIEVQQQGLEKQGVILEKMIRDRCEGENGEPLNTSGTSGECGESGNENSKEVENLILQLFELVNEKNELFRRQAELMYLRRQHRLEQEQADLEYEIRILMAQPERNKTDSDKAREEALIERLVEVVKLRNEVVECLEMDRLREAEEDQSIKQRLESHIAKRDDDSNNRKTLTKLSKKEKKKQKEAKKLIKSKKLDADKDADESELNVDKQKSKKKKKLLIF